MGIMLPHLMMLGHFACDIHRTSHRAQLAAIHIDHLLVSAGTVRTSDTGRDCLTPEAADSKTRSFHSISSFHLLSVLLVFKRLFESLMRNCCEFETQQRPRISRHRCRQPDRQLTFSAA